MERRLTVELTVRDSEAARAIWDTHLNNSLLAGCNVRAIAEGSLIKQLEKFEHIARTALEKVYDLDPDLPETVLVDSKVFYQWPYGIYSDSDTDPFSREWFADIEALRKAYPEAISGE